MCLRFMPACNTSQLCINVDFYERKQNVVLYVYDAIFDVITLAL